MSYLQIEVFWVTTELNWPKLPILTLNYPFFKGTDILKYRIPKIFAMEC